MPYPIDRQSFSHSSLATLKFSNRMLFVSVLLVAISLLAYYEAEGAILFLSWVMVGSAFVVALIIVPLLSFFCFIARAKTAPGRNTQ